MFKRAERKKAKLRLALCGPSGSGKTWSALLLAQGLGGKIAMVDTEHRSGELYAHLCEYDVAPLEAPYTPKRYIELIKKAEAAGYDILIIDSLSHAWSGEGGILDMKDRATKASKSQNSFTSWREVTPEHNALVEAILKSSMHIIATMRTKTAWEVVDDGNGKKKPVKIGLAPIQREGMEFEFTVVLDLSIDGHVATSSKDRTSIFDGQFMTPTIETGKQLLNWLEKGSEPAEATGTKKEPSQTAKEEAKPKTKNFEFLKNMKSQKDRVGNEAYYKVLGSHGFEHANEISDRETQVKVFRELAALNDNKGAA